MKRLILASGSPRRRDLLTETGLVFEVIPSTYEEDMTLSLPPKDLAIFLSQGKAKSVAEENPDAIVIGADTFVFYNDKVIGKPHTKEKAKETLDMLNGKEHLVITGFTMIYKSANKSISKSVETRVLFKNVSEKEIDNYIDTGEPLEMAGAYAIQGLGKFLVDKIEGDYKNVMGLPVDDVLEVLKEFGV